jgi:hypothetical protein
VKHPSANPAEPTHAAAQREVQRKLGRCMLRIQQYEIQLKSLVGRQELAGPPGELKSILAGNIAKTSTKTLGQLVSEFTKDYVHPTQPELGRVAAPAKAYDETWVSLRFSVEVSPERHAALCEQLTELVGLRNRLVHHFVESYDLMSVSGCEQADVYLNDCYVKIDADLLVLRGWAAQADKVRAGLADQMSSPDFWNYQA